MTNFYTFLVLFALSFGFIWCFKFYACKHNLVDHPNQRSSHVIPTVSGGGVVFVILWLLYVLYSCFIGIVSLQSMLVFLPGAFLVALIGFVDDHKQISARWRFLIYLIAATISIITLGGFSSLMIAGHVLHWGWVGSIFAIVAIVWSINLYNFMDGIDGIAAIEAVFVFGIGGYFIWNAGGYGLAMLAWGLVVLIFGFLVWNFPPAKIFMGDVGSAFLGFLVVVFALAGEHWYKVPAILWLMLYGVFAFDATVTLIRRVLAGEKWYTAHRLHAYQRLQLKNWSHKRILLRVIAINVVLAVVTLGAYFWPRYFIILFVVELIMLAIIYLVVEKMQPMYEN
jgi:Fuc2NAc and GlcNAc transferase